MGIWRGLERICRSIRRYFILPATAWPSWGSAAAALTAVASSAGWPGPSTTTVVGSVNSNTYSITPLPHPKTSQKPTKKSKKMKNRNQKSAIKNPSSHPSKNCTRTPNSRTQYLLNSFCKNLFWECSYQMTPRLIKTTSTKWLKHIFIRIVTTPPKSFCVISFGMFWNRISKWWVYSPSPSKLPSQSLSPTTWLTRPSSKHSWTQKLNLTK